MQTTPAQSRTDALPVEGADADAALAFWRDRTGEAVCACLEVDEVSWSRACPPKPVPDDAAKLVLRSVSGQPLAVLVGSSPPAPDMAARHARRCDAAVQALPEVLASVVLGPMTQGEVEGRSYVVWPFCQPGAEGRLAQWRWRRRWAKPVSDWLLEVNRATRTPIASEQLGDRILSPLSALLAMEGLGPRSRNIATAAVAAFSAGEVSPIHVLMHNDLWTGNVLAARADAPADRYPFTIIDWAGAEVAGYPGYDLARWAQSIRLKPAGYGKALKRHADVLGCEVGAMPAHLAVGLGYLAMHLEGFAPQRFVRLADECLEKVEAALESAGVQ